MNQVQPVILAGGSGTRLWPLSRELYPKQLINLTDEFSLLQSTVKRIQRISDMLPSLIVAGFEHRFMVRNQLHGKGFPETSRIILEPVGRNTAPAICAAAIYCQKEKGDETVLLILPADHLVGDQQRFSIAVAEAVSLAAAGNLVTFGVRPVSPETGYGYIEAGDGHRVLSFVEKPDRKTAQGFLEKGRYYWNSGMFAFPVRLFCDELKKFSPDIYKAMELAVIEGREDGVFFHLDEPSMALSPSDSIDYALMEKSERVAMVRADFDWSDIGSWQSLWNVSAKDADNNVIHGDVILEDVTNSLIHSEYGLVTAVGLRDMLLVETADAVLAAPLSRSQDVKKIASRLKRDKREEHRLHKTAFRPWGSYTLLEQHTRYQIKRITVNPGSKLSMQMHHHRSEHWVVVKGTARITCGEEIFMLHENQSTYIPAGEKHRLENPGTIPLEIIEVQNGSYLGEDDIIRFDDDFGRQGEKK